MYNDCIGLLVRLDIYTDIYTDPRRPLDSCLLHKGGDW